MNTSVRRTNPVIEFGIMKEKQGMIRFFSRGKLVASMISLSLLSACSGSFDAALPDIFNPNKVVLPCPAVSVLPNADTITVFQDGPGRDLVDVEYEGIIAPVSGECFYENDDTELVVELILRIGAIKGPAAKGQTHTFPFFVAIADSSRRILTKKILQSPVEVAEGRRRGAVQEEIVQRIPLPTNRDGRDYTIVLGLQLTKEELEYNRNKVN